MAYDTLLVDRAGPVLTVTLNRPPMNPLSVQMQEELRALLNQEGADERIRAIILTGAGERAFCAGADITEFASIAAEGRREEVVKGAHALMTRVDAHPKPIIAAINGYAFGGGFELAMACHLRVMSESATVGLPEIRLGIVPGYGGTQMLARLAGKAKALEMMLLAQRVGAADALQWGLVNRVAPAAQLMDAAHALAAELAKQAPLAASGILTAVTRGIGLPLQEGFALEREMAAICHASADATEGAMAFLEKREPTFQGK